ncbi:MAG: pirin family protein [Leucobacter sp.]
MSNPEQHPVETICRAAVGTQGVEILEPREVPLGGLRAMPVRRTLPQRRRSLIGAWCFLDHYGPDDVAVTGGMNVPAHPHTGLQTVSWLFSGEIEHRDSAGFHALVRPGELNLMTAGHGISHSERSTPRTTVLHGAQLWVALPEHARGGPKTFEHYAPPVRRGEGWTAQVFLGSLLGEHSPVEAHTPLLGAELRLAPGAELSVPVDAGFEHGVLLDTGELGIVRISGDPDAEEETASIAPAELAFVPAGAAAIRLRAGGLGARLLLLGGEPMADQIVMWWNFIGRSHEDIARARADWQAQIAAVGVADVTPEGHPAPAASAAAPVDGDRFGLPDGEPEPPLPAPPLPIARLVPRTR